MGLLVIFVAQNWTPVFRVKRTNYFLYAFTLVSILNSGLFDFEIQRARRKGRTISGQRISKEEEKTVAIGRTVQFSIILGKHKI